MAKCLKEVAKEITRVIIRYPLQLLIFGFCILCLIFIFHFTNFKQPHNESMRISAPVITSQSLFSNEKKYNANMSLIFIGGNPSSGTTLARAMLDAHPDIRCGEETKLIKRLLEFREVQIEPPGKFAELFELGLDEDIINSAMSSFILELIVRHGELAPRLCNKDPLAFRSTAYLSKLFPNSKFIFMIHDGRASAHSIMIRDLNDSVFNVTDFRQCLTLWDTIVKKMHSECNKIGAEKCLRIHYEQLVLHPRKQMSKILKFLDVPWNESVLHHDQFINKPGGIALSQNGTLGSQVKKPVYLDSLSKWVGNIPNDCVRNMRKLAPMLAILGYDPDANPPNYTDLGPY